MRVIHVSDITNAVRNLFIQANYEIGQDVFRAVQSAREHEESGTARAVLGQILENYEIARSDRVAICQDTGMAVVFLEIGQDVHFVGGDLNHAIQQGVREAYREGYLRASVVADPLYDRLNTKDNTPAVLHLSIVPGENVHILATCKGFGSENMSRIAMLTPAAGEAGVLSFIVDCVNKAGPNSCPPVIVGVGVGGTFEQAALLAKHATTRPVSEHNPDPGYAALESKALLQINRLGIGAAGIGGTTTALAVAIEHAPTHIAGLPVAVNICCHAARHAEITL